MGKTYKDAVAAGKEYWGSRLHRHGETPGAWTKDQTHRKERRHGKKVPVKVLHEEEDDGNYDG